MFVNKQLKSFNAQNHSIVIWSEARHYWSTYQPLVKYFQKNNIDFIYLASHNDDMGLVSCENSLYIGGDKKAFSFLNGVTADIVIMTTPNLGDLAVKRSKNVKHYINIVHAPTDMHTYRRVGFECFDTILCAGQHQIDTLRHLEKIRHTEPKQLLKTGCLYFDIMQVNKISSNTKPNAQKTILIAPTWGQNNILKSHNLFMKKLIDTHYEIIIRPHPQSMNSEKKFINHIHNTYKDVSTIHWDIGTDGTDVFNNADILITNTSGVAFDFAFIYKKPVLCIQQNIDFTDMEGNDISYKPWEIGMTKKIGLSLAINELHTIDKKIEECLTNPKKPNASDYIFNFQSAGAVAGKQIIEILRNIRKNI